MERFTRVPILRISPFIQVLGRDGDGVTAAGPRCGKKNGLVFFIQGDDKEESKVFTGGQLKGYEAQRDFGKMDAIDEVGIGSF